MKIGNVLKAILKAEDHQQDLIVAAIGNFAQKANAVKVGLAQATTLGPAHGHVTKRHAVTAPDGYVARLVLCRC
ncbi:hypothetical protein [Tardiphaga sp. P9-11]|uniref:hypothetical protein n=1 Tax=Tardiphaga sp. P9-11 TaxID=2024614 RepID=UPI0011F30E03|nr:hypothetical protein [Tardiphaga sp. P9-11]